MQNFGDWHCWIAPNDSQINVGHHIVPGAMNLQPRVLAYEGRADCRCEQQRQPSCKAHIEFVNNARSAINGALVPERGKGLCVDFFPALSAVVPHGRKLTGPVSPKEGHR